MPGLTKLIEGYRRFRAYGWQAQRERWQELAEGQQPNAIVIACSDSRVDPARIFDSRPGEIFSIRNVANLVPPYGLKKDAMNGVLAALEFGVTQLKIPDIIVIGHAACGGVHAALTHKFEDAAPGQGGYIANWVRLLDDACDRITKRCGHGPEAQREMELETVRLSLANLRSFPFIQERVKAGTLKLHGAYFAVADGVLHVMDENGAFHPA